MELKLRFKKCVIDSLRFMRENPDELEKKPVDMLERLRDHMDSSGQGSANEPKPHEACIAVILEMNDIKLSPQRNRVPVEDGCYFWYQPGGSQQKGDFMLFWVYDGIKQSHITVDAKHSNGCAIYLNDGWFWEDTVYVVSYCRNVRRGEWKNECFIGLGQDIPTEKDNDIWNFYNDKKKEMNTNRKELEPDYLQPYFRFAHQYSCKQFDPDFTASRFVNVLEWLQPTS